MLLESFLMLLVQVLTHLSIKVYFFFFACIGYLNACLCYNQRSFLLLIERC